VVFGLISNLLEGVIIAYLNPDDEEYIALYPEGADFDLVKKH